MGIKVGNQASGIKDTWMSQEVSKWLVNGLPKEVSIETSDNMDS